jgi:Chalcone isomerase-like
MKKLAVALSFLLLSSQAFALDVAGVNVAPTVSSHQKTLTLNGAGIRKKLFIKVYVGSLYTERKVTTPAQLLADPGEKLIRMSFVHKKVEKEKIVESFSEGLSNNSPIVRWSANAKAFLSWFTSDFVAGDTVDISVSPDGTVSATHNGKVLGTLRDPAVAQAVLLIWFGEKPADGGLKKGMLGQG